LLVRARRNGALAVTGQSARNAVNEFILGARTLYLGLREYHDSFVLLDLGMQLSRFFHAGLHAS
jgi:hypothetical protein